MYLTVLAPVFTRTKTVSIQSYSLFKPDIFLVLEKMLSLSAFNNDN